MANTKGTSVISNPTGGGAQSGIGQTFSPDLFTGTGNFSVPITVPQGRNGFQPTLTLAYSSGSGNGIFGFGWAIGISGVMRKTSKGIPVYDDKDDIFILSGAEDLVPVKIEKEILVGNIGYERTFYRPRTEGSFARIIRHKKTTGEHYWEVRSKDGLISWYGTPGLSENDPSVIADPLNRNNIFSWALTKTEDPFGNVILYEYERDLIIPINNNDPHIYDQIYLSNIKYAQYQAGSLTNYLCEVKFHYEERQDIHSTYKQGFEVRTKKRCFKIETYTNATSSIKIKTYHFNYLNNLALNGVSLLKEVKVEGHNNMESEFMPPLAFAYSNFDPIKPDLKEISGPIPLGSLDTPGFELVDVTGNGLPDLLQLNGSARYWTNKGNGKFSPPKDLNIAPSFSIVASKKAEGAGLPGVAFIDANGDGRTDLMILNGINAGYFPGAFQKVWDSNGFHPFTNTPSFSLGDPEVQLIDLDGDGITDVLRNGSKFECFYNEPGKGFNKVRTAFKTFADFSFSDPRIRFADMTGDGLQDIVLISSGRIQYWPNMGYGRFGKKVNMTNAPVLPEQYDPKQILLGDLDGDGQCDVIFIENNKVTLYINQSGNSFSDGVKIVNTPRIYNLNSVRICDIMGVGQTGLLWSFGPDSGTPGKMYFLDFTKNNKPYVLEKMDNNMGSITKVEYGSSVYHFLRDEKNPTTRWKTQLPFPVQVVNKVEIFDLLSGGKLVTEYNYHNGYWDGVEREFRGFAHVDSRDTESFERFNIQSNSNPISVTPAGGLTTSFGISSEYYNPPTLTKNWFYVGPVGDSFSRWHEPDFSNEYWNGDTNIFERPQDMLSLLNELPRRARRDALRTLRGTLLRSELYGLDGSSLETKPYTVTEGLSSLRMEFNPSLLPDPLWGETSGYSSGGGYIFFPFNIAKRTSQYERGTDPLHNFSFTKSYDAYGQAQGQLNVGMPRGSTPLSGGNGNYLSTYSITEFIYKDVGSGIYMVNRSKKSIGYDASQSAFGKSIFTFKNSVFDSVVGLPVISCEISFYDGNAFTGLAYGEIGNFGVQVRSEALVLTDTIINDAYGSNIPECFKLSPDWSNTNGYPTAFAPLMQDPTGRMGYKQKTGAPYINGWYAESARLKYDFQVGAPYYGLKLESKDVFNDLSTINYDVYNILPVSNKQWLNGTDYIETTADYDYRLMQPYRVKDFNDNYSVFDFSPVGLLLATALIGKGNEGDYKSGSGTFYDRYSPSVRMEYDFFAFKNNSNPVSVKTISRELHYQQSPTSNTIIKIEYSDGLGRLLQTRVQAEDVIFGNELFGSSGLPSDQNMSNENAIGILRSNSDPLNVVVTGWKVYNNKGKTVEEYEPFFDKGFDYIIPDMSGVKIKSYYDPLQRLIRTINPDNSEQRIIYGLLNDPSVLDNVVPTPWITFTYDANDLASITNPTGSNVPNTHWYTPKMQELDALNRCIKTIDFFDNSNYTNTIEMNYTFDVRSNLLEIKDPYNRNVFNHIYDLRTPQKEQSLTPIWTKHIDKGESTVLFDAVNKPIETEDSKGAVGLSAYDVLNRCTHSWASNKTGDNITLRNYVRYGDSAGITNPENYNLKTKIFQSYDEAGFIESPLYDFKGNLLNKTRKVIKSSVLKASLSTYTTFIVDWTSLPNILDSFAYSTDMQYDALNRITLLVLPQDLDAERKQLIPAYNNAGSLEKVDLYSPTGPTTTNYVENIVYNSRGQRLLIAFGNNRMTRYTYDASTFRLLRQRTEGYSKSTVGNIVTYTYSGGTNKQDDAFNYDLIGNIVNIFIRVSGCGIGGTPNELDRTFEYDSLYRLNYADGRESNTQSGNAYLYDDAPVPSSPIPSNVNYYERNYTYDKLGNINSVIQNGVNGFTRNYSYNTINNFLQKIEDSTPSLIEGYTYDSCGNTLTTNLNRYYVWNYSDQLICYYNDAGSGPTVFTQYDYVGHDRVSKMVRTGNNYERTIYIDGIFQYVKLETASNTYEKNYIQIMDDKSQIAELRINPGTAFPGDITDDVVYILEDQIRSSVVRLNTGGTIIDEEEYYPFGDSSLRTFTYKRYRYVAKERDAESGLYYYGARYYAAWTGRFINVDPLASKYPQLSSYNYSDNNPINDYDIDGMQNNNSTQFEPPPKEFSDELQNIKETMGKEGWLISSKTMHNVDTCEFTGEITATKGGVTRTLKFENGAFTTATETIDHKFQPLGGSILATYNNELRNSYHKKIEINAKNNLVEFDKTDDATKQKEIANKSVEERNVAKKDIRKKLTPDSRQVTKMLEQDAKYDHPDKVRKLYGPGGEKGKNLTGKALEREVVKASGRPNGKLATYSKWMRRAGWVGIALGTILSAKRIAEDPTPATVGEETGATIGGFIGSLILTTLAVGALALLAPFVAVGTAIVLAVSFIAGVVGGMIGSHYGGKWGREIGGWAGPK